MKKIHIKRKVLSLLFILVMIISMAGCGTASKNNEATSLPSTAVFTDMLGREVKLSTNIKRIALVRTSDIYMLSSILGKELDAKLVAVGESFKSGDIDGYNVFSKVYKNLDNMKELGSVYDDAINVESVVDLNPDIIIVDKYFYNKSCIQKMISVGLPVVFIDNNSDPFYGPLKSMQMVGKMIGKESKADEMANYAKGKIDAVLERVQKVLSSGTKKPVLYWECGNVTPDQVGPTDGDVTSDWGCIWDKLGADSISIGVTGQPLNPEKVLATNPDIIIIGGDNWNPTDNIMRLGFSATQQSASEHLGLYTKRAGWSDLNAIKNGRLYALHYNITDRAYSFAAFEEMAKMLYPKEFSDLDPDKDIQEFFTKYMEITYSGIHWAQWNK